MCSYICMILKLGIVFYETKIGVKEKGKREFGWRKQVTCYSLVEHIHRATAQWCTFHKVTRSRLLYLTLNRSYACWVYIHSKKMAKPFYKVISVVAEWHNVTPTLSLYFSYTLASDTTRTWCDACINSPYNGWLMNVIYSITQSPTSYLIHFSHSIKLFSARWETSLKGIVVSTCIFLIIVMFSSYFGFQKHNL